MLNTPLASCKHASKLGGECRCLDLSICFLDKTNNLIPNVAPIRAWHKSTLSNIMRACIILHNIIVEDDRAAYPSRIAAKDGYDTSNSYSVTCSYTHRDHSRDYIYQSHLRDVRGAHIHI